MKKTEYAANQRQKELTEKSFEYVLNSLLSMDELEIVFPNRKKYSFSEFVDMTEQQLEQQRFQEASENMFFVFKFLYAHFETVKERVKTDSETLLKVIDVQETVIQNTENFEENQNEQLENQKQEMTELNAGIKTKQGEYYFLLDMVEFIKDRVDEFILFISDSCKDSKETNNTVTLMIKEKKRLQKLIETKFRTKFPIEENENDDVDMNDLKNIPKKKNKRDKEQFEKMSKKMMETNTNDQEIEE